MTDNHDEVETRNVTDNTESLSPLELLKAQVVSVDPNDTMAEAGRKILLVDFIKMLENEAGSRTGQDIEHVHDMRVATRRMRSAFRLLGDYYKAKPTLPYQEYLKQLAGVLGSVRDLDVMIEALAKYQATLEEADRESLQVVIDKLDKRRSKAREILNATLDGKSYRRFVEGFGAFLTEAGKGAKSIDDESEPYQVRHVVPMIVNEHVATVRAYDNVLTDAPDETFHALRIEFKRLRYTVDFFTDVLGPTAKDFIEKVKEMQDHLGRFNDISVAEGQMQALIEDGTVKKAQKPVIKRYVQALEDEKAQLRETFPTAWEHFNTRTVQTKLMNALLALR